MIKNTTRHYSKNRFVENGKYVTYFILIYENKALCHRKTGPSLIDNATKEIYWSWKGLSHRDNGPSVITNNKIKAWYFYHILCTEERYWNE